jgi:hypothetical protein
VLAVEEEEPVARLARVAPFAWCCKHSVLVVLVVVGGDGPVHHLSRAYSRTLSGNSIFFCLQKQNTLRKWPRVFSSPFGNASSVALHACACIANNNKS